MKLLRNLISTTMKFRNTKESSDQDYLRLRDDLDIQLYQTKERLKTHPHVVCLCGSTRFVAEFVRKNFELTLSGAIVLSIGCDTKSDDALGITDEQKVKLDNLHLRKIEMSDEVYVLNVGGYIGESTTREIKHAMGLGIPVKYLEPHLLVKCMECKGSGYHDKIDIWDVPCPACHTQGRILIPIEQEELTNGKLA